MKTIRGREPTHTTHTHTQFEESNIRCASNRTTTKLLFTQLHTTTNAVNEREHREWWKGTERGSRRHTHTHTRRKKNQPERNSTAAFWFSVVSLIYLNFFLLWTCFLWIEWKYPKFHVSFHRHISFLSFFFRLLLLLFFLFVALVRILWLPGLLSNFQWLTHNREDGESITVERKKKGKSSREYQKFLLFPRTKITFDVYLYLVWCGVYLRFFFLVCVWKRGRVGWPLWLWNVMAFITLNFLVWFSFTIHLSNSAHRKWRGKKAEMIGEYVVAVLQIHFILMIRASNLYV